MVNVNNVPIEQEEYGGADARDAFIVILTNIFNHVHKH